MLMIYSSDSAEHTGMKTGTTVQQISDESKQ